MANAVSATSERHRIHVPFLARPIVERCFKLFSFLSLVVAMLVLVTLIGSICIDGISRINIAFFTSYPSRFAEKAGILSSVVGSIYLMVLTIIISFPIGVGAAVYLEEYAKKNLWTHVIELNIANLAGVP